MEAATVGTPAAQGLHHNALAPVGQLGLGYARACVCTYVHVCACPMLVCESEHLRVETKG